MILLPLCIVAIDSMADPGIADDTLPNPTLSCYNAAAVYVLDEDD